MRVSVGSPSVGVLGADRKGEIQQASICGCPWSSTRREVSVSTRCRGVSKVFGIQEPPPQKASGLKRNGVIMPHTRSQVWSQAPTQRTRLESSG